MFAGIDIGTGSVKGAFLFDDGTVMTASAGYAGPAVTGVQSSSALRNAAGTVLREAARLAAGRGEAVRGIAASGHGPSLVMIDREGAAQELFPTWQDNSAVAESRELSRVYPGFSKTGECWEAKLLSFWKKSGRRWRGEKALYPKDYLNYLLCGRAVIDRACASTHRFYDENSGTLNGDAAGIDSRIFPDPVESTECAGTCGTAFSRSCGISDGVPVYGGGIDAWCEAVGAGAVEPGMVVDGSGTSTCVSVCLDGGESPLLHVIPDRSYRIETISYTGGSIQWAGRLLGITLEEWKKSAGTAAPIPVLFLPYLIGERSPVWDEDASALFLGLRAEDGPDVMMGAVLQGTAMAAGQCLRLLSPSGGLRSVRAVGGGALNRPWLRMKASITGASYLVMRDKDAAPLGAGILAAFGAGEEGAAGLVRRFTRIEEEIEPDPETAGRFQRLARVHEGLYETLKDNMKMLAGERRLQ